MIPKQSRAKVWISLGLTVACVMGAYGFYRMNPQDTVTPFFFGFGLLGIMMSVLRNRGV